MKKFRLSKLNSPIPYIDEFTVFIKVKIAILNEFSNEIPLKLSRDVRINNDNTKINTVKKYLSISLESKLIFVNISLLIKIFFGLLNESI